MATQPQKQTAVKYTFQYHFGTVITTLKVTPSFCKRCIYILKYRSTGHLIIRLYVIISVLGHDSSAVVLRCKTLRRLF